MIPHAPHSAAIRARRARNDSDRAWARFKSWEVKLHAAKTPEVVAYVRGSMEVARVEYLAAERAYQAALEAMDAP